MNTYEIAVKKNSLLDFWNWWSDGANAVMEIRTTDWKMAKHIGQICNLPFGPSGVFVSNYKQLKLVLQKFRMVTTLWFGINPRRKAFNKKGMNVYGGLDANVHSISYIFLDIDRVKKNGPATESELNKIKQFTDLIINDIKEANIFDYCRIYSGNGMQILFKLDVPIILPQQEWNAKDMVYVPTELFDKHRYLIKNTIFKALLSKFNTPHNKKTYGCEIDPKCWNIGRVGALPYSRNLKYSEPIIRGVFDYGTGINKGLSDALIKQIDDIVVYNNTKQNIGGISISLNEKTLYENPLIKFLLSKKLPDGNRNSHLIFPLKCLLQQNGFNLHSQQIQQLRAQIEKVQGDTFPFNPVRAGVTFNPHIVNSYCMEHMLPLLYPDVVLSYTAKKRDFDAHIFDWDNAILSIPTKALEFDTTTTMQDDLFSCHKHINNGGSVFDCAHALKKKYHNAKQIYELYLRYWAEK